jgi:putative transposase
MVLLNDLTHDDVLDMHNFDNLQQVKEKSEEFIEDYKNNHPHDSLKNMSPVEFMKNKHLKKVPNFIM